MLVKELRKALRKMPGEMPVYAVNGNGLAEAKHVFRLSLVGVEQFCEIRTYFEDHTPDMQDSLIERNTGFNTREELIDAYKKVKDEVAEEMARAQASAARAMETVA